MQSFVKEKGENLPVGVDHKHTPSSEQSCLVPCVCLCQEKMCRGPALHPAGGGTPRGAPVPGGARGHTRTSTWASGLTPAVQAPRVSSLLLGDESFTDNWKVEFWKRSIYLKENRSYLLPPVKYYGNMSANNLLCVICSNANRQQLGHFLWRIPLWLPRYAHTGTSPERCAQKKAHAALPPQEIPLPGKQKHVFGGTFAVLHSLSQAGPQTCAEALQEELGFSSR